MDSDMGLNLGQRMIGRWETACQEKLWTAVADADQIKQPEDNEFLAVSVYRWLA